MLDPVVPPEAEGETDAVGAAARPIRADSLVAVIVNNTAASTALRWTTAIGRP